MPPQARTIHPVDDYTLGHLDGQKQAAPSMFIRMMDAEGQVAELRAQLRHARRQNSTLRRLLNARLMNSGRLAIACSSLTFVTTYNVMLHGWFS